MLQRVSGYSASTFGVRLSDSPQPEELDMGPLRRVEARRLRLGDVTSFTSSHRRWRDSIGCGFHLWPWLWASQGRMQVARFTFYVSRSLIPVCLRFHLRSAQRLAVRTLRFEAEPRW